MSFCAKQLRTNQVPFVPSTEARRPKRPKTDPTPPPSSSGRREPWTASTASTPAPALDRPTCFIDGRLSVTCVPSQNLVDSLPFVRLELGAVETQSGPIADRYQAAIDEATETAYAALRQARDSVIQEHALVVNNLQTRFNEASARLRDAQARLDSFGIARHAKYRALEALEAAGLISVERRPKKGPIVTILDEPTSLN